MKTYIVKNEKKMTALAAKIAKTLKPGSLVLLSGDLGAGKSVFARGIIGAFKFSDNITSPSFTIVNTYENKNALIYHFDFYRLEEPSEAYAIGADEMIANTRAIKLIEWPEKATDLFTSSFLQVNIDKINDTTRRVIIQEAEL